MTEMIVSESVQINILEICSQNAGFGQWFLTLPLHCIGHCDGYGGL